MLDIRTENEKKTAARHAMVCAEYKALLREYPSAAPGRLMSTVAGRNGLTVSGVRLILIRHGAYVPATRRGRRNGGPEEGQQRDGGGR